jgi:hypothetical protein
MTLYDDTTQGTSAVVPPMPSYPPAPNAGTSLAGKSLVIAVVVAAAAFAAVLSAGVGWRTSALVLGLFATVTGLVLLVTPPRPRSGTGFALTGVVIGAAALLFVPFLSNADPLGGPTATNMYRAHPISLQASDTAPAGTDDYGNAVTFVADNLVDGDLTTAWRVPGDGVSEGVLVAFAGPTHLRSLGLTAGYTTQGQFTQNRRLERVTFVFDNGSSHAFSLDPASRQVQYTDVDVTATRMVFRIDATTSAQQDFAAVSEIEFWAQG